MKRHLAPHEFVDAIEGRLAAARDAHLRDCAACRAQIAELSGLLDDLPPAGDVPSPSPLFWDAFSRRVRMATSAEPDGRLAWRGFWRPAVVLAGLSIVAVLFVISSRPTVIPDVQAPPARSEARLEPLPVPAEAEATVASAAAPQWDSVVAAASELPWDDVRTSAVTKPGTVDLAIADLSSAERLRLAKLLQSDLGGTR